MFIVIESVVGGGKKRQPDIIASRLRSQGKTVHTLSFPDRASVLFENIIYPCLHEDVSNTPQQRFMAFLLDQLAQTQYIERVSKNGLLVTEGYYTSTLAYQALFEKAMSIEDALKIAKIVKLPIPDLAIYIDTPLEKAKKVREIEEGYGDEEDFWADSLSKLDAIDGSFKKMIREQTFCKWKVVDGSKKESKVTEEILDLIQE